jgi:hypothetical protein
MPMPQPLQIIEILGPSDQGKCRPYRCRAEDGAIYYVKGRQTNRGSLWNEWICAHLATAVGLNVPAYAIVEVCDELLAETPHEWRDIGAGLAFGSRLQGGAAWLETSMAAEVPVDTQRDVLVFDWWIRNGDRTRGNPNLLWDTAHKALVVIDHNLAFDPDFSSADFLDQHIFGAQWAVIESDLVVQADYGTRLSLALAAAQAACDNGPPEWMWANAEMDVPARLDLAATLGTLARCATPELWRTV